MPLDGSQSLGAQGHHRAWLSLRSPGATARHPAGLLGSSHVPFLCPLPPEVAPIHPCLLSQDSLLSARPVHPLFSLLPPLPASDGWQMAGQSLSRALARAPPRASCVGPSAQGLARAVLLRCTGCCSFARTARSWPPRWSCFLRAVFIYSLDFCRRPLLSQAQGMKAQPAFKAFTDGETRLFPVSAESSQAAWSPPKGQRLLPASPAAHPGAMTSWALLGESMLLTAADCCLRHAWGLDRPWPRLRGEG